MAKPPRKRVNPYIFQLLKKLIEYEVDYFEQLVNKQDIFNLFYAQVFQNYNPNLDRKKKGRAKYAAEYVESFIKSVWEPVWDTEDPTYKSYCYSTNKLDELVTYINKAGSFNTWEEFVEKYKNDPGAIAAEEYLDEPFFAYGGDVKRKVDRWVIEKFIQIDFFLSEQSISQLEKCYSIEDKNSYLLLRSATLVDLEKIFKIDRTIYPCDNLVSSEKKIKWHHKNPNIFYILPGNHGRVAAHINLLPITNECYYDLAQDIRFEDDITANDIYSLKERDKVKHIYIESFVCTVKYATPFFAKYFEEMLMSISDLNDDTQLSAIAGTDEGRRLLKNYGFKKINLVTDPSDNSQYEFVVTRWGKLKSLIRQDWRHEGKASINKPRLTLNKRNRI